MEMEYLKGNRTVQLYKLPFRNAYQNEYVHPVPILLCCIVFRNNKNRALLLFTIQVIFVK